MILASLAVSLSTSTGINRHIWIGNRGHLDDYLLDVCQLELRQFWIMSDVEVDYALLYLGSVTSSLFLSLVLLQMFMGLGSLCWRLLQWLSVVLLH